MSDDSPNLGPQSPSPGGGGSSRPAGVWEPPSPERLQEMLPQFEVISVLGRGGMGAVYRGRQISLDRLVAIKILPPEALEGNEDANFAERFRNEARAMAKMNHPGIVGVYDFGATPEGQLYIAMEFVDGTDVSEMIKSQGPLPAAHALAITAHVCDALQYAHDRGVIHRDIKPANVMVNREGQVKLADFGLAKATEAGKTGITRTNMAMGTPDFIAPEALISGVLVDHRADLYAVGVMLYQMLTGKVPRGAFKPASQVAGCDPRYDAIIHKAMQTEREDRYQSALEIRRALDVILTVPVVKEKEPERQAPEGRPGVAQSARQSARPPGVSPPPRAGRAGATHGLRAKPPPASSSKMPLVIGIAAVAALIGGGLFFMMGGRRPAEADAAASTSTAAPDPSSPSSPPALSTSDFAKQVAAAATPEQQVELVTARLKEINGCDFEFKNGSPVIVNGKVTTLYLHGTKGTMADLSPFAALRDLKGLQVYWLDLGDLSGLRGLQLESFWIHHHHSSDLSVFKGMPLKYINMEGITRPLASGIDPSALANAPLEQFILVGCDLSSIEVLKTLPVKVVNISGNKRITSLDPLRGKALSELRIQGTGITDLALIRDMPLKILYVDDAVARTPANRALIEGIASLTKINEKSPAEFWKALDASPAPAITAPSTPPAASAGPITWTDSSGRALTATFKGIEGDQVVLEILGKPQRIPMSRLSAASQQQARALASASSTASTSATKDAPFVNSLGMKFVPVPGTRASFSVWLTRVQDYAAYAAANPQVDGSWKTQEKEGVPIGREPDHPVVAVSWEDAQAFCAWLTTKEQAEGKLPKDMKYRLPSDEEWSIAVSLPPEQGATPEAKHWKNDRDYPWGNRWPPSMKAGNYADETFHAQFPKPDSKSQNHWIAGYTDGYATTSPVGSFPANAHGLHDMGGNVWQWCEDWWNAENKHRVLRGNSFPESNRARILSSIRHHTPPDVRYNNHGFRCVLAGSAASSTPDGTLASPPAGGGTRDLFNGRDFTGWTGPGSAPPASAWTVQGGVFSTTQRTTLWSEESFGDFEFEIEWKVGPGGNGGVFYHVPGANELEAGEMQLTDPTNAGSGGKSGALFGIVAEKRDASKPVGEWNTAKLVARGSQREHWINGELVVRYYVSSADFRKKLDASRMRDKITFATNRGKFVLQANAGEVSYRNARIRVSGAPPSQGLVTSAATTDPRLAQLEAAFKTEYAAKAQQTYDASVAALNTSYVGALGRARTAAQTNGVLAEVTVLDDELKRIQNHEGVPAADEAGAPAALATLRKTYRDTVAKHAAARAAAAAPVYDAYMKALDDYIVELTRADKLEDAKRVKALRDGVAAQKPGR